MFENAWDIWYLQQELDMVNRDEQIKGLSELVEKYKNIQNSINELKEDKNWQFSYRTPGMDWAIAHYSLHLPKDIMDKILETACYTLKLELECIAEDLFRTYGVKL